MSRLSAPLPCLPANTTDAMHEGRGVPPIGETAGKSMAYLMVSNFQFCKRKREKGSQVFVSETRTSVITQCYFYPIFYFRPHKVFRVSRIKFGDKS